MSWPLPGRFEVYGWEDGMPADEKMVCGAWDDIEPAIRQADALVDPRLNHYIRAEVYDRRMSPSFATVYVAELAVPLLSAADCLRPRGRLSELASRLPGASGATRTRGRAATAGALV